MATYISNKQGFSNLQTDQNEISAELCNIFEPPIVDTELQSGYTVEVGPINALNDDGPYEFDM